MRECLRKEENCLAGRTLCLWICCFWGDFFGLGLFLGFSVCVNGKIAGLEVSESVFAGSGCVCGESGGILGGWFRRF